MARATPIAIVAGSTIVAAGLYFGLQASRPAAPETTRHEAKAAVPPGPTTPIGVSDAEAQAAASTAVEAARAAWITACWDTADAKTRRPGRYLAALAFDAKGTAVVAGISEIRGESDPGVATCLRAHVGALRIPAPGRMITLEVRFAVP